jgi:hypothetical protein
MFFHFFADAQYWSKRFDLDAGNENGDAVSVVSDGFIVNTLALCRQNSVSCVGIVKLDFDGNIQWKTIEYDSIKTNHTQPLQIRNDTIFVFANYQGLPNRYYTILSYDLDGNFITKHDFNESGTNNWARNMSFYANHAFVTYCFRDTLNNQHRKIIKFNQDWTVATEFSFADDIQTTIRWQSVRATPDSGCIISYTHGYSSNLKLGIEKFDTNGELQWKQGFYPDYSDDPTSDVLSAPDGGYYGRWRFDTLIQSVFNYNRPSIIFKLDAQGNYEWQKIYVGIAPFIINSMFVAQNGDFITVGEGYNNLHDSTIVDIQGIAGFVKRFNPEGELVWARRISDYLQGGIVCNFIGGAELPNQDLIFSGSVNDTLPDDPYVGQVWVVKTDSNGCLTPDCGLNQTVLDLQDPISRANNKPDKAFVMYPIPFKGQINVVSVLGVPLPHGKYEFELFNILGHSLVKQTFNPDLINSISIPKQVAGSFVATISIDGKVVQQEIVVGE